MIEDSEAGIASGLAAGLEVLRVPAVDAMPGLLRERLGLVIISTTYIRRAGLAWVMRGRSC